MPLTFLSHQAPVLPLKIVAPRWFDGTALVIGSMAPDLFFVTQGSGWYLDAHESLLGFAATAPLTLVLTWLTKRVVAGPVGVALPDLGPFHLQDYARLSAWRTPSTALGWAVLLASAIIGALTHVVIDSFTHGFGWVVQHVAVLRSEVFVLPPSLTGRTVFVHDLLQLGATVVGAAITLGCLLYIGRRRLIADWYPTAIAPAPDPGRRRRLIAWTLGGLAAGLICAGVALNVGGAQDFIIRVSGGTFAGLVIGCVVDRRATDDRRASAGRSHSRGR